MGLQLFKTNDRFSLSSATLSYTRSSAFFFSGYDFANSTRRVNLPKKSNYLLNSWSIYSFIFLLPQFVYYIIIITLFFKRINNSIFLLFILPNNYVITWKRTVLLPKQKSVWLYVYTLQIKQTFFFFCNIVLTADCKN